MEPSYGNLSSLQPLHPPQHYLHFKATQPQIAQSAYHQLRAQHMMHNNNDIQNYINDNEIIIT